MRRFVADPKLRVALLVAVISSCSSSGGQSTQPTKITSHASATTSDLHVSTTLEIEPGAQIPAPPQEQADLSIEFSLQAVDDDLAPWVISVVAKNNTNRTLNDGGYRILERWDGVGWAAVAVIPFDLASPGELMACEPDAPCGVEAAEVLVPAAASGQRRTFRVKSLDDGVYRVTEPEDGGYTVDSNRINIEDLPARQLTAPLQPGRDRRAAKVERP